MRVSSVTRPLSSGTLKSTRTSARFPRTCSFESSRIVFFFTRGFPRPPFLVPRPPLQARPDVAQEIHASRRVAPLVVVPARNFYQQSVDDVRALRIQNARMRISYKV